MRLRRLFPRPALTRRALRFLKPRADVDFCSILFFFYFIFTIVLDCGLSTTADTNRSGNVSRDDGFGTKNCLPAVV